MIQYFKGDRSKPCELCNQPIEQHKQYRDCNPPHCPQRLLLDPAPELGTPKATERSDYFLFLDYETTGDPERKLLEVSWMLTDSNLEPLMDVQSRVIRQENYIISDKILKMHTKNGLLTEVAISNLEVWDAEHIVCTSIGPITEKPNNRVTLAGFTPHYDRELMQRDMPKLDRCLHYRHFDVSVLRAAYHYWVEKIPNKKDEHPHRGTADILACWEIAKTFKGLFESYMPKSTGIQRAL